LQSELNSEKLQRLLEANEKRLDSKMDDLMKKVDQATMSYVHLLQNVNIINTSVVSLKDEIVQIKSKQEHLILQQNEMQKAQNLLVSRQDQLFSKQDQIQSTLADDRMSTPSKSSTVAWPSTSYPPLPNVGTTATSNVYFNQGGLPVQLDTSEISSYVSDMDLESLLALDWDAPSSSDRQVEIVGHPGVTQSNGRDAPSSSNLHAKFVDQPDASRSDSGEQKEPQVQLIDPSIVIKKNSHLCNDEDVGRLAVTLAREAFFGESVLLQSTVTGKKDKKTKKPALDNTKLSSLLSAIHADPAFSQMSKEDFSSKIKPKIMTAIAHHCKYLRKKWGKSKC